MKTDVILLIMCLLVFLSSLISPKLGLSIAIIEILTVITVRFLMFVEEYVI
jgi:hypothetical protein